jgi:hypothetical protein
MGMQIKESVRCECREKCYWFCLKVHTDTGQIKKDSKKLFRICNGAVDNSLAFNARFPKAFLSVFCYRLFESTAKQKKEDLHG